LQGAQLQNARHHWQLAHRDKRSPLKFKFPRISDCAAPFSESIMTHVVSESCIQCKYTDCVDVCPVDCFREGPNFLTIDPDECIDCAVCIPECPVNAIYAEEDLPADQQHMTQINAELALLPTWKSITKRKAPLATADEWKDKTGKLGELIR
jgi:ferredoxin